MNFSMRKIVIFGVQSFFSNITVFLKLFLVFVFYTFVAIALCSLLAFLAIECTSLVLDYFCFADQYGQASEMLYTVIASEIVCVLLVYYFYYQSLRIGFYLINKEAITLKALFFEQNSRFWSFIGASGVYYLPAIVCSLLLEILTVYFFRIYSISPLGLRIVKHIIFMPILYLLSRYYFIGLSLVERRYRTIPEDMKFTYDFSENNRRQFFLWSSTLLIVGLAAECFSAGGNPMAFIVALLILPVVAINALSQVYAYRQLTSALKNNPADSNI